MEEMLQVDFANIEATINAIVAKGEGLSLSLYHAGLEASKREIECKALEGAIALRLRESGVKVTEGHVTAVVDADADVCALRQKHKTAVAGLAKIRADLDCLHDTRRMLVAWMNGQSKAGMEV